MTLHSLFVGLLSDWLRDPHLLDASNIQPYLDILLSGMFGNWDSSPAQPCSALTSSESTSH